jgi:Domain of unknown function (DUF222)
MEVVARPADLTQALDDAVFLMTAASAEALELVALYDEQRLWVRDGATSMASWLAGRFGLAWGTAREWVRVAHALRGLPKIREAYASGRLSWDQVRPLPGSPPPTPRSSGRRRPPASARPACGRRPAGTSGSG